MTIYTRTNLSKKTTDRKKMDRVGNFIFSPKIFESSKKERPPLLKWAMKGHCQRLFWILTTK